MEGCDFLIRKPVVAQRVKRIRVPERERLGIFTIPERGKAICLMNCGLMSNIWPELNLINVRLAMLP